jgi:Clp amino terminal domain, pathogenicity island component
MAPAPSLQDLIDRVIKDTPDQSPLVRLQTAASMMRTVGETADGALGYFVDQARRAGHSWSDIGESLGVSKQAAHQRHGPRLSIGPEDLERLTERARGVLASCETAARSLGHSFIGTEHLLLAQYAEPESLGAQVLVESGLSADAVRRGILDRIGEGSGAPEGQLSFTPRAVQALSTSLAVAVELGHNYIGTEHLLLGTARGDGVAATLLQAAGLDEATLRSRITARLASLQPPASPAAAPKRAPTTRARPSQKAKSARR